MALNITSTLHKWM